MLFGSLEIISEKSVTLFIHNTISRAFNILILRSFKLKIRISNSKFYSSLLDFKSNSKTKAFLYDNTFDSNVNTKNGLHFTIDSKEHSKIEIIKCTFTRHRIHEINKLFPSAAFTFYTINVDANVIILMSYSLFVENARAIDISMLGKINVNTLYY